MSRTFVRSLTATKKEGKISVGFQPYIVGIYGAATGMGISGTAQMSFTHTGFKRDVTKMKKSLEKDGFVVETQEREYTDFISVGEYLDYIEPEFTKKKIAQL